MAGHVLKGVPQTCYVKRLRLSNFANLLGAATWKFLVRLSHSAYIVFLDQRGIVQVIENGRAIMRLCLQPVECLPDADIVVLHKLMIEGNEEAYLQKANKYVCID